MMRTEVSFLADLPPLRPLAEEAVRLLRAGFAVSSAAAFWGAAFSVRGREVRRAGWRFAGVLAGCCSAAGFSGAAAVSAVFSAAAAGAWTAGRAVLPRPRRVPDRERPAAGLVVSDRMASIIFISEWLS